ncbi:hypothetical protein ASF60_17335 [Methylobacterium sp. Leaf113]|uniref:hypothetical protein n=1 Tax=Methylobacterium sp. Leaf113 TaxID=1736259 RepID=UPI0007010205|nr:hypothetical protein [Methylobacterium sp. Leaf113]KQP91583.1 hypothetical protein ASF60_17335 [Methylobacterium sp. Leaf113]
MKFTTVLPLLVALAAASPALADDQGNANAEQQTQPTPNRGGTAGGPGHRPTAPDAMKTSAEAPAAKEGHHHHPKDTAPASKHSH